MHLNTLGKVNLYKIKNIKSGAPRGPTFFVIGKIFFSADPRSRSFFYAPQSTNTKQILRNSLT